MLMLLCHILCILCILYVFSIVDVFPALEIRISCIGTCINSNGNKYCGSKSFMCLGQVQLKSKFNQDQHK